MRTILQKTLLLIALTIFFGTAVYAVENSIDPELNNIMNMVEKQKPTIQSNAEGVQTSTTSAERIMLIKANILNVQIVAALYAFSLVIIIILMRITDHHAKDIVTIVGLVSVIFATLLLVLMIADTQQLIAPIGIFGAIAGYLFGAAPKKEETKK